MDKKFKFISLLSLSCLLFPSCGSNNNQPSLSSIDSSNITTILSSSTPNVNDFKKTSNRVEKASDMVADGTFTGKLEDSFYDDNHLYYTFYLGRVYNFIIHIYETMEYSSAMKLYGNHKIEITEATETEVKETYRSITEQIKASTTSLAGSLNYHSSKVSANSEGIFKTILNGLNIYGMQKETSASLNLSQVWSNTVTETSESIYESVTKTSNKIVNSWTYDYDQCVEGVHYCFCTTADVDCFATIIIDRETGDYTMENYTSIVTAIEKKVLTSNKNDFLECDSLTLDLSEVGELEDPERYYDNHPVQSFYNNLGNHNVICPLPYHPEITSNDENFPDYQTLVDYGYNSVNFNIAFTASGSDDERQGEVSVINIDSTSEDDFLAYQLFTPGVEGTDYSIDFLLPLEKFISNTNEERGFFVEFDSKYPISNTIKYKDIKVTISIDYIESPNYD